MQPDAISPETFARSVRALLTENPKRYRCFGCYWYFVKALLARFYDVHNLYFLRGYEDASVVARMPPGLNLQEYLALAAEEYGANAKLNLGRNLVTDPDGEAFMLLDPDVEG